MPLNAEPYETRSGGPIGLARTCVHPADEEVDVVEDEVGDRSTEGAADDERDWPGMTTLAMGVPRMTAGSEVLSNFERGSKATVSSGVSSLGSNGGDGGRAIMAAESGEAAARTRTLRADCQTARRRKIVSSICGWAVHGWLAKPLSRANSGPMPPRGPGRRRRGQDRE